MSRRVLVTGGSQGIGLAIARGLAAAGDEVTVLSRRPPRDNATPPLFHLAVDLRSPESIHKQLEEWLDATHGEIDALVHCAVAYGSRGRHPVVESSVGEWDDALNVTARGLLLVLAQLLPPMLHRGRGLIVGISSDVAVHPGPGRIPYAASKAAAHAIMTGLAEEIRESGVCALELMPTHQVDTPGIRSRRPADFEPVGYSDADSFVPPILWLLDNLPMSLHGSCLQVDAEGHLLDTTGEVIT